MTTPSTVCTMRMMFNCLRLMPEYANFCALPKMVAAK